MNAIQRLAATVEWMVGNGVDSTKVPKEVKQERLEICRKCEHFTKSRQCGLCLCFMDVKASLVFDPVQSAKQLKDVRTICAANPPKWPEYLPTNSTDKDFPMITTAKNQNASSGSILVMNEGAELCCGDVKRYDFVTAEFDSTANNVTHVNVTVQGGSAQTIALTGGLDLSTTSAANNELLRQYMAKVATDLGFIHMDGGIDLERNPANADLVKVRVKDSTLIWNWIGIASTFENAFVQTDAVP